ncbi:MAG: DUF2807 domain-containing protein [Pseudomonadota bacterium]|nr:DUF2807 domain-containing protein [Pseudomonadota bacterium]
MRKAITIGVGLAAAAATAACDTARGEPGEMTSRSYTFGGFDRIEVAGPYEVQVRTGGAQSVQATGNERGIERMIVEVKDGALRVHPRKRNGWFGSNHGDKVQLTVTVPALRGADIAGSGSIAVDRISGDSFEGEIAGSGDLRLGQVEVNRLKMGIAGSGEIQAAGRARQAEYDIAGSGHIGAAKLVAETAAISIAGSGNIAGHATGTASVDIAGSGNVALTGGATCAISKAGSGNVTCS